MRSSRWALDWEGKLKAPPPVALIVFVGVEVKETPQESACCRFLRNPSEINIPSASMLFSRFPRNVKQCANASRCWLCTSFKRKNDGFWHTQFCTEVAHPTRFERVVFAFGGQRSLKKVRLASKQVYNVLYDLAANSLGLAQSEKILLPPLMSGSLRTAATGRDCTRGPSGMTRIVARLTLALRVLRE